MGESRVLDTGRADRFMERMVDTLNQSALALLVSIGHRTGLFDVMAGLAPATSDQVAHAAGLDERYVREWLGGMVVGRVVEYDPARRAYSLPPEHAACLTRAAAPNNLASYTQYVAVLGAIEDRVLECFRNGGGVPYDAYHRFHEVMAEDSAQSVLPVLVDGILPLVPGMVDRLRAGIDVLDVGCGRGRALLLLAREFPASRFTGLDLSAEATTWAAAEARRAGLANLRFVQRDMRDFAEDSAYDLVTTFDAVHDQARPDRVVAAIARALRPGGIYLMQDIGGSRDLEKNLDHPFATFLYTASCLHCMSVSLAQPDGLGLGTMWGVETAREMLEAAGFDGVEVHHLPHDAQNVYFIARRTA